MSHPFMQETQWDQGPKIVSHTMENAQSVALGIFVDVGSRDEKPEQAGMAHALEHMVFKGTRRLDVHSLAETLDLLGGHANAFTSRERTCFHTQVLYEDTHQALDLLMDLLLEPALPEDEWKREREVIFSEMGMVEDTPDEWVFDQHIQAVYADQSVGKPTLGTRDTLSTFSTVELRNYLETWYRPPRLLISAAGRIDHQALVDAVNQRNWPAGHAAVSRPQATFHSGKQYLERSMEQVQVVASFPCIHATSEERPIAWLANQMLGGSMSSALFREIRERRGLAYGVDSHLSPLSDTGLWSISCDTHPNMLVECLNVLQETMLAFPHSVDEALLQRAKRQMEVQFRMGMDSIEGNMMYLAARLDEEELRTQQQWIDAIQAVQHDDIQTWVEKQLTADALWTVAGSAGALSLAQSVL